MRTELKNPKAQQENAKESITGRTNQAEDRTSALEDKTEDLDQITDLFPCRNKTHLSAARLETHPALE